MYYVYGIKNIKENKYYVGVTTDIGRRFNQHLNYGIRGYENIGSPFPDKKGLYVDMYRLGIENFMFKVLEKIDTANIKIAYNAEERWIRSFNSVENGYNTVYNAVFYAIDGKHKLEHCGDFEICSSEQRKIYSMIKNQYKLENAIDKVSNKRSDRSPSRKSKFVSKSACSDRFVYAILDNNKLLCCGSTIALDKHEAIERIKDRYRKNCGPETKFKKHIWDNGEIESFNIQIIYKCEKTLDISSIISDYIKNNRNNLVFEEYAQHIIST